MGVLEVHPVRPLQLRKLPDEKGRLPYISSFKYVKPPKYAESKKSRKKVDTQYELTESQDIYLKGPYLVAQYGANREDKKKGYENFYKLMHQLPDDYRILYKPPKDDTFSEAYYQNLGFKKVKRSRDEGPKEVYYVIEPNERDPYNRAISGILWAYGSPLVQHIKEEDWELDMIPAVAGRRRAAIIAVPGLAKSSKPPKPSKAVISKIEPSRIQESFGPAPSRATIKSRNQYGKLPEPRNILESDFESDTSEDMDLSEDTNLSGSQMDTNLSGSQMDTNLSGSQMDTNYGKLPQAKSLNYDTLSLELKDAAKTGNYNPVVIDAANQYGLTPTLDNAQINAYADLLKSEQHSGTSDHDAIQSLLSAMRTNASPKKTSTGKTSPVENTKIPALGTRLREVENIMESKPPENIKTNIANWESETPEEKNELLNKFNISDDERNRLMNKSYLEVAEELKNKKLNPRYKRATIKGNVKDKAKAFETYQTESSKTKRESGQKGAVKQYAEEISHPLERTSDDERDSRYRHQMENQPSESTPTPEELGFSKESNYGNISELQKLQKRQFGPIGPYAAIPSTEMENLAESSKTGEYENSDDSYFNSDGYSGGSDYYEYYDTEGGSDDYYEYYDTKIGGCEPIKWEYIITAIVVAIIVIIVVFALFKFLVKEFPTWVNQIISVGFGIAIAFCTYSELSKNKII